MSHTKFDSEIDYDHYRDLEEQRLPVTAVMYFPREEIKIFLRYSSLKLSSENKKDIYSIKIPAGYRELKED